MDRLGALLVAMRAHKGRASVQLYGCGVFKQLLDLNWPHNVPLIAKAGGIDDVVMAIRIHRRNANVQQHGFLALCALTFTDDNAVDVLFAKAGGIVAVCDGMRAHPSNADVQGKCSLALANVTAFNAENQVLVAKAGGIEAVTNAMRVHPSNTDVHHKGCLALVNIARNDDNKVMARYCDSLTFSFWNASGNKETNLDPGTADIVAIYLPINKTTLSLSGTGTAVESINPTTKVRLRNKQLN